MDELALLPRQISCCDWVCVDPGCQQVSFGSQKIAAGYWSPARDLQGWRANQNAVSAQLLGAQVCAFSALRGDERPIKVYALITILLTTIPFLCRLRVIMWKSTALIITPSESSCFHLLHNLWRHIRVKNGPGAWYIGAENESRY